MSQPPSFAPSLPPSLPGSHPIGGWIEQIPGGARQNDGLETHCDHGGAAAARCAWIDSLKGFAPRGARTCSALGEGCAPPRQRRLCQPPRQHARHLQGLRRPLGCNVLAQVARTLKPNNGIQKSLRATLSSRNTVARHDLELLANTNTVCLFPGACSEHSIGPLAPTRRAVRRAKCYLECNPTCSALQYRSAFCVRRTRVDSPEANTQLGEG